MSSPTETPSPLPTLGDDAVNEERGAPPGMVYNIAPMTIAIDNEGGIPYVRRLTTQVGSEKPGEGESQPSVGLLISTDIHISFQ